MQSTLSFQMLNFVNGASRGDADLTLGEAHLEFPGDLRPVLPEQTLISFNLDGGGRDDDQNEGIVISTCRVIF